MGGGQVGGGGPSNFIVNQSPNLWIFGFKTFDFDFGLDNIINFECFPQPNEHST